MLARHQGTSLRTLPRFPSDETSFVLSFLKIIPDCSLQRGVYRERLLLINDIAPEHFHPSLSEGPCLTRAAEPPADQFGTLALPAHNQRESRRLGGRHRPAPGFPDRWAGSRTETI